MRTSFTIFVAIVSVSALLTGCAIGNKHQYAESIPAIDIKNIKNIALGVQDNRVAVVNKTKSPDFVGIQRGGFGNPFDVTTASGNPLATDISTSLATAIREKGVGVQVISIEPGMNEVGAAKKVSAPSQERGILLLLNEWKSDTFQNTALHYNLDLRIYDLTGKLLAHQALQGSENLGGSFMNPPEHAKGAVPLAYRKKMEDLFSKQNIAATLK